MSPPGRWRLLAGAEVLFGAILGCMFLGTHSLWLDEGTSAILATAPWHRFAETVVHREANMSFYYFLLRGWVWFGHGTFALRSLSVLAATGMLALVLLLARRLFGVPTALLCGLLLAVDPFFIEFAQDARGYALSILLVVASSLLFVRGIQEPSSRPWATWISYAVVSALAAYTNFWAALVPVSHAVSLVFLARGRIPWRRLVPVGAALVVLLLPMAALIHETDKGGVSWASGSAAGHILNRVRGAVPHVVIDLAVLVGLVVVTGAVILLRRRPALVASLDRSWPVWFVACWSIIPAAVVLVLSIAFEPLLVIRYLMVSLPPIVILVAAAVVWLATRTVGTDTHTPSPLGRASAAALLAIAAALSIVETSQWYEYGGPADYQSVATYLGTHGGSGDGVLFYSPYERIPIEWYFRDDRRAEHDLRPVYPSLGWGVDPLHFDYSIPVDQADLERSVATFQRVWFVLVSSDQRLYPAQTDDLESGLRSSGFAVVETRVFRGIDVLEEVRPVIRAQEGSTHRSVVS